jgi:hypothetical protein
MKANGRLFWQVFTSDSRGRYAPASLSVPPYSSAITNYASSDWLKWRL